jgi:serine/threonine protein kinase
MIESVVYIHSKGVRHSDLRLEQWLVDEHGNARLSDFNPSGFDHQPSLGLKGKSARGFERSSHYLPRPYDVDSSVASDLFALGSSLYELVTGQQPYHGFDDNTIEALFAKGSFPKTEGLDTIVLSLDVIPSRSESWGLTSPKYGVQLLYSGKKETILPEQISLINDQRLCQ